MTSLGFTEYTYITIFAISVLAIIVMFLGSRLSDIPETKEQYIDDDVEWIYNEKSISIEVQNETNGKCVTVEVFMPSTGNEYFEVEANYGDGFVSRTIGINSLSRARYIAIQYANNAMKGTPTI